MDMRMVELKAKKMAGMMVDLRGILKVQLLEGMKDKL